jgi:hypothetical protein
MYSLNIDSVCGTTNGTYSNTERNLDRSVVIATGCRKEGMYSNSGRNKIYLFATASRSTLRAVQPPIQWVPGGKAARA